MNRPRNDVSPPTAWMRQLRSALARENCLATWVRQRIGQLTFRAFPSTGGPRPPLLVQ